MFVMRFFSTLFSIFIFSTFIIAQNNADLSKPTQLKNAVSLEFGGVNGWYGLHYERLFFNSKNSCNQIWGDLGYAFTKSDYYKYNSFTLQLIYNLRIKETDKISYSFGVSNHYFVSNYSYYVNRGPQSYYSSGSIPNYFLTGKLGINFQISRFIFGGVSLVYIPKINSTREFTEHLNINNTQSDTVFDYINPKRFWFGFKLGYKF